MTSLFSIISRGLNNWKLKDQPPWMLQHKLLRCLLVFHVNMSLNGNCISE